MEREVKRSDGDGHAVGISRPASRGRRGEERGGDEVRTGGKGAREMHGGGSHAGLSAIFRWRGGGGDSRGETLQCDARREVEDDESFLLLPSGPDLVQDTI